MEEQIETLVETLTGSPVRLAITITAASLLLINIMWWATTRKDDRNIEQHLSSIGGAALLGLALIYYIHRVSNTDEAAAATKQPDKMIAIEASIARKTSPQKQPQKQFREPDPVKPPDGVSHDDKKIPDPPKKKEPDKPKKPDDPKTTKPPDRRGSIDDPVGPVKDPVGPPSDNKRGFASVTKGDPFFQQLAADVNDSFEYPKTLESKQLAAGCFYFNTDGKIAGWKLLPKSGDDTLDDAVERALKKVEKLRAANPQAIPVNLLEQATTSWTCFQLGNLKRED